LHLFGNYLGLLLPLEIQDGGLDSIMRYYDLSHKKIRTITIALSFVISGVLLTFFIFVNFNFIIQKATHVTKLWNTRMEYEKSVSNFNFPLIFLKAIENSTFKTNIPKKLMPTPVIPVLLYHGILPESNSEDVVSIATFKAQMFALKAAGWNTITIEDFVDSMNGKKSIPSKSFLITFDDGRKDSYYNADSIFQVLDYNAVMYVITGHSLVSGNEKGHYYLSESELNEMIQTGRWELQSHSDIGHSPYPVDDQGKLGYFFGNKLWIPTQNQGEDNDQYLARIHSNFVQFYEQRKLWPLSPGRKETIQEYTNRVKNDLLFSKNRLWNNMGINSISFSYPYDDFGQTLNINSKNGSASLVNLANKIYLVSFYQWYYSLGYSENYIGDGQLLKRIEVKPFWNAKDLIDILDEGQPKSLPYTLTNENQSGWKQAWGKISSNNGSFVISATNSTTGASTILDGTRLWKNYNYTANIDWENANSVSLMGHYQADPQSNTYVECNFSKGTVTLENVVDGFPTNIISEIQEPLVDLGKNKNIGMNFNNNHAKCLWNNRTIAEGELTSSSPDDGGIGMEVWGPKIGQAKVTVHIISVTKSVK
jgi:hypothetical protein